MATSRRSFAGSRPGGPIRDMPWLLRVGQRSRIERAAFSMSEEPYVREIERSLIPVAEALDAALAQQATPLHGDPDGLRRAAHNSAGTPRAPRRRRAEQVLLEGQQLSRRQRLGRDDIAGRGPRPRSGARRAGTESASGSAEATARAATAAAGCRAEILLGPASVRDSHVVGDVYGSSLANRRKASM